MVDNSAMSTTHQNHRVRVTKTRAQWARLGDPMPRFKTVGDVWSRWMLPEEIPCNFCGSKPASLGLTDKSLGRVGQADLCDACHDIETWERAEDSLGDG